MPTRSSTCGMARRRGSRSSVQAHAAGQGIGLPRWARSRYTILTPTSRKNNSPPTPANSPHTGLRGLMLLPLPNQLARDHDPLDVAGALVDLQALDVPVVALNRVGAGVAAPAVDQYRVGGRLDR